MCMNNQNYLINALDTVLSLDLPDEVLPMMLSELTKLNAHVCVEDVWPDHPDQ
jgi:hypothetical protein